MFLDCYRGEGWDDPSFQLKLLGKGFVERNIQAVAAGSQLGKGSL